MKTVLVAGDVIDDFNLLRLPASPMAHSEALPNTILQQTAGGAWHLEEMIALACRDCDQCLIVGPERSQLPARHPEAVAAQAFSLWAPYPRLSGSRERVWRIERFLGSKSGRTALAPDEPDLAGPPLDLLAIDDINLGFRASPERWQTLLSRCDSATQIVLKSTSPMGDGALWAELATHHTGKITLVLDAASLRRQHALISQGLSWDRTIEEFQREITEGISGPKLALARRVVVGFGVEGVGIVGRHEGRWELEHFVYDPGHLESEWQVDRPGITFGATSILTAAIVRHTLDPATFPLFVAAARALAAMRASHEAGGGSLHEAGSAAAIASFDARVARDAIESLLHPDEHRDGGLPEQAYRSAFPHRLLRAGMATEGSRYKSDLLTDLTGSGYEYAVAKAMEVVTEGISPALDSAPRACYGSMVTVDREEIERLNEVRRLILAYAGNESDRRPLSLAVFGPPGSGKSFAIKQLAVALFGRQQPALEFNLSQFGAREELHQAFEQVRDASVKGQLPLVFWDEFDTEGLRWLRDFLAPMQDAEYRGGSVVHPFGKAIFVFAGGTCSDFQSFNRSAGAGEDGASFRAVKGPDFVSRLRGYVNVKGPNPWGPAADEGAPARGDVAHLIRRAILLRSLLERSYERLIDPISGTASISPGVVSAFLRVKAFHHGARSLEAVVSMSAIAAADYFGVAELPSPDLLDLHVTPDFMDLIQGRELELAVIEATATAIHASWRGERERRGWRWGPTRDDAQKIHPRLVAYAALTEPEKEANRTPARVTVAKLDQIGYRIVPAQPLILADEFSGFTSEERTTLMEIEHEIWLRDHLLRGYAYAAETNDRLRLHKDITAFERLSEEDTALDAAVVDSLPSALSNAGYRIARIARITHNERTERT